MHEMHYFEYSWMMHKILPIIISESWSETSVASKLAKGLLSVYLLLKGNICLVETNRMMQLVPAK